MVFTPTRRGRDVFAPVNSSNEPRAGVMTEAAIWADEVERAVLVAQPFTFGTVAELLANTTLAYVAGTGKLVTVPGDWIRAGPHLYQTAASSATDHHVTLAGGVKLYVTTGAAGAYNVLAFGALANGTANDTAPIKAAIAAGPRVFFPDGHYRVDGTVTVPSNRFVFGAGPDLTRISLLNSAPADAWALKVLNADDVVVSDMSLEGNVGRLTPPFTFSGGPFGSGLIVQNSRRVYVVRVNSTDWAKHCFDISANAYTSPDGDTYLTNGRSSYVWLDFCYAKGAGDDNFTTHQSDNIRISNCFSESPSGLFVANNSNCYEIDDGSRNVQLVNVFARDGVCGIQVKGHINQPAPQNVLIDGAHIDGCNYAVDCYNTDKYGDGSDTHGTSYSNTAIGLTIKNVHITDVKEARVTGEELPFALRVRSYAGVVIDNIQIMNCTAGDYYFDGLVFVVSGARNVLMSNITFTNCTGFDFGIYTSSAARRVNINNVSGVRCTGKTASAALVRLTTPGNVNIDNVVVNFSTNLTTIINDDRLFAPTVGSNKPLIMQTPSTSSGGSGGVPAVGASIGWVEGASNDLGPNEGSVYEMTCELTGETVPTRVAAIGSSKTNGTDSSKAHDMFFQVRNLAGTLIEAMRISSEGLLGVGVTPTASLHTFGAIRHATYTVAGLPSASASGAGARAAVTNATATTFNSIVAGGGSNFVPVISDGTNWRIG